MRGNKSEAEEKATRGEEGGSAKAAIDVILEETAATHRKRHCPMKISPVLAIAEISASLCQKSRADRYLRCAHDFGKCDDKCRPRLPF